MHSVYPAIYYDRCETLVDHIKDYYNFRYRKLTTAKQVAAKAMADGGGAGLSETGIWTPRTETLPRFGEECRVSLHLRRKFVLLYFGRVSYSLEE